MSDDCFPEVAVGDPYIKRLIADRDEALRSVARLELECDNLQRQLANALVLSGAASAEQRTDLYSDERGRSYWDGRAKEGK